MFPAGIMCSNHVSLPLSSVKVATHGCVVLSVLNLLHRKNNLALFMMSFVKKHAPWHIPKSPSNL